MDLGRLGNLWNNSKCLLRCLGLLCSNVTWFCFKANSVSLKPWNNPELHVKGKATTVLFRHGMDHKGFLFFVFSISVALLCSCSACKQTNFTCETNGACMVSISNMNGIKHHVRTCIAEEDLIPVGKPFYCLSSEDLRNTHCCYFDFCNKIDLMVPSGKCLSACIVQEQHVGGIFPDD